MRSPSGVTQAAILVGGAGTRLGNLTAITPKPLLPCGGRPFLAWLLDYLGGWGISEALLLAGPKFEAVANAVPEISATLTTAIRLRVLSEVGAAGTAGALRAAAPWLAPRFLLCNGDSVVVGDLLPLVTPAVHDTVGHLALADLQDASRYGTVELRSGRITAFQERPAPGAPGIINAGIAMLDHTICGFLPEQGSLERDVYPVLATVGRLRGTVIDGWFIDIGVPADYARAAYELPGRIGRAASAPVPIST